MLNYVWLRGRCRYCRAPIPIRLPLVEALTGALFVWAAYRYGVDVMTAVFVVNACFWVVVFFIDLHFKLILDKLLLVGFPLVLVLYPFGPVGEQYTLADAYLRALEGAGVAFGIMLVIYLLWRGGMGAGDVKLAAMVGAATGYPLAIFVLLMAFIAGGAVSLLLVGLRSKGWKEELPFGSFLAVVVMTGLMVKGDLYGWYLDLFGL